jgi:hypothetical protein
MPGVVHGFGPSTTVTDVAAFLDDVEGPPPGDQSLD